MPRYVALLRGINVGGKNRVPMARLRTVLEEQGCTDVRTLLQSGNVLFTSRQTSEARLTKALEGALEKGFGFPIPIVLRTAEELARVVRDNPLPGAEDEPARFLVVFLAAPPPAGALAALKASTPGPEEVAQVGREVYGRFPQGIHTSKLATKLMSGRLGVTATARNWATVLKLLELD